MTARTFTSAADAAIWYVEQGIYPVPVAFKGKKPKGNGWEQLRIDAASVPSHFNGQPSNIGALLGTSTQVSLADLHLSLTDIDLDSPEALSIAPAFLPATGFVFGRASKPASHWFYLTWLPMRLRQFKDPLTKTMLLELRGTKKDGTIGLQTVLPGSTHYSGELIAFEDGHDSVPSIVTEGETPDLEDAVRAVAAGALLCRYWPTAGRHDSMLALAGALARGGVPQAPALKFCRAVYTAVPTHTLEGIARIESEVKDSFDKIAAGEPATGFPSLTKHIDGKIIETAFDWLGLKAQPAPLIVTSLQVGESDAGADWRNKLQRTKSGELKATYYNAELLLRHSPAWQNAAVFNEFSLYIEAARDFAPFQRYMLPCAEEFKNLGYQWQDTDSTKTIIWLQRNGVGITSWSAVWAIIKTIAHEHPYHPIKDYLASLVWDGKNRIDSWLHDYLGAEESLVNDGIGAKYLVQAVARIMHPGCLAHGTLLLIGPQGFGKSTTLRVLASPEFFSGHLSDLASKDSRIELHGRWIIEMSEFTSRRSELERKSFLTQSDDIFRPPYEIVAKQVPRSNVFAATSNDDSPLTDATGGRRYWSVTCGITRPKADIEKLKQDRDQLWAEAYQRFLAGASWHDDSPEFAAALAAEQETRYTGGPFDDVILPWLRNPKARPFDGMRDRLELRHDSEPGRVTLNDVLLHACGKAQHEINQRDRLIARDCLVHAGWKLKISKNAAGTVTRFYVRKEAL